MQEQEQKSALPGVWSTLAAGFDLTAKHPWIILLPMLVDVFIWLGPRLRFQRIVEQLVAELPSEVEVMEFTQQLIEVGPHTNLFSVLSVPLIGVPALLAGLAPEKTPISARAIDINSGSNWLALIFVLSIAGLFLSALYYVTISVVIGQREETGETEKVDRWFKKIGGTWLRFLGLALLFLLVAIIIYIPISIIGAVFFLLSPLLGTMVVLVAPFIIFWIAIYLSFTPPGITLNNRSLIQAVKESVQLVQKNLPVVLLMILAILLLGAIIDWLLIAAENGTWFTMFNILIHAFVHTGFVTAFFILYQDRSAVLFASQESLINDGSL
jgi:hypothetical protein